MTAEIEAILSRADEECEGANYHDRVGQASKLFSALEPLVAKSIHTKLARAIVSVIIDSI